MNSTEINKLFEKTLDVLEENETISGDEYYTRLDKNMSEFIILLPSRYCNSQILIRIEEETSWGETFLVFIQKLSYRQLMHLYVDLKEILTYEKIKSFPGEEVDEEIIQKHEAWLDIICIQLDYLIKHE